MEAMRAPNRRGLASSAARRVAELTTVFLGVALAFLADNWREELADRRTEEVIREGLAADFAANQEQLVGWVQQQERVTAAVRALGDLLDGHNDDQVVQVPDTLLMAMIQAGSYDPARGSLDALLSSGQLALIQDAALRQTLAAWPSRMADALRFRDLQRDFIDETVQPFLFESGVSIVRVRRNLAAWRDRRLPPDARTWVTPLRNSAEFRNIVEFRRGFAGQTRRFYQGLAEAEAEVLELLLAGT